MNVYSVGDWAQVIHGEALPTLKTLPDNVFHCVVCDPPGSASFMHRSWDSDKGGREKWVAWLAEIMREAWRVTRPGGYAIVWAFTKRAHWTALALEDAGWVPVELLLHLHCQGMPKALNVAKDLDRILGATPRVVGPKPWKNQDIRSGSLVGGRDHEQLMETEPVTEEAKRWDGWFSGIKPAVETWWLVQKPISESSIARNILRWETGALNIAATSVRRAEGDIPGWHKSGANGNSGFQGTETFQIREMSAEEIQERRSGKGRFTPNLLLQHHPLCQRVGTQRVKGCPATVIQGGKDGGGYDVGSGDGTRRGVFEGYGDAEGMEECDLWACVPGYAIREMDRQSGPRATGKGKRRNSAGKMGYGGSAVGFETQGYSDTGTASRFFPNFPGELPDEFVPWLLTPKPSRSEKEAGLDDLEPATLNRVNPGGLENENRFKPVQVKCNHPTVKGLSLCRWLLKLVCPPGGIALDPFLGSGSIGVAAGIEGFRFLGIEQGDPLGCDRYVRIAVARMLHWSKKESK